MSTGEWETCRKLETGRGRNVNTAVGREETCKIKREKGRNNTILTQVSETFKELKSFQYLQGQTYFTKE
jgi:hypothetical protein